MIFLWIFNTSICHHITVKYKFTNLPHYQKDQTHFSGRHLAGRHLPNQNHFQFSRHIHIRLHILRMHVMRVHRHAHLWSVYRNNFPPSDRCR